MGQTSFKINGTPIKRPSTFNMSRYNLTNSDRLGSGTMTMEIKAKKRKFFFTYAAISSIDKAVILGLIWEGTKSFFTLSYVEDDTPATAIVYVGEIAQELIRTSDLGGNWYWKDFNFNLIEK